MTEEIKTLDLDELFGQARKIQVKWQGKEFELLSMDGISPTHALQLQALQNKVNALRGKQEPNAEDASQMEQVLDEILVMIGKDLPLSELTFNKKLAIIHFYIEETQGKKALEVAQALMTGATSSAD